MAAPMGPREDRAPELSPGTLPQSQLPARALLATARVGTDLRGFT
jgi:hypothetical protein